MPSRPSDATLRFLLLLLVGLAGAVLLVSSFVSIAGRADHQAVAREEQLVAHGIEGWIRDQENRIEGQVNWDDALQNLGVQYDPSWASANVGQFFYNSLKLERAVILDGQDRPLYAMVRGQDVSTRIYNRFAGDIRPLIDYVRAEEAARQLPRAQKPYGRIISQPIQQSAIALLDGKPILVTVSLVQPDFGRVTLKGPRPSSWRPKISTAISSRRSVTGSC